MGVVLDTIVPVFAVVALGYWLGGRGRLDRHALAWLVLMVTSPALVFSLFYRTEWQAQSWWEPLAGAVWTCAATAVLAAVVPWRRPGGRRGLLIAAMFWNAGNMGLSVNRLAFGQPGLETAAIIFVTVATVQAVFGTWVAKGRGGAGEVLRMPLVHAAILGVIAGGLDLPLPKMLTEPIDLVGQLTIPLMLITLGLQLRHLKIASWPHALTASAIRIGGGLGAALVFVSLLGVDGLNRDVLILQSCMPTAVIAIVFAQRYDADPDLVASTIVASTLISVVTTPLVLALVIP